MAPATSADELEPKTDCSTSIPDEAQVNRYGHPCATASGSVVGHVDVAIRVAQARGRHVDGCASASRWPPPSVLLERQVDPVAIQLTERAFQSLLLNEPLQVARLTAGNLEQFVVGVARVRKD
jgi:hypothetical protein